MNKPIGVIDSGVGGLTVAKEIMRQLPNETIYYLGDIDDVHIAKTRRTSKTIYS